MQRNMGLELRGCKAQLEINFATQVAFRPPEASWNFPDASQMLPKGSRIDALIWRVLTPPGLLKPLEGLCTKMVFGTSWVQNRAFEASPGWFCMKFQRASFLYQDSFQKLRIFNDSAPVESSGRADTGIRHGIAICA